MVSWLESTLKSISIQTPSTSVAICAVEDTPVLRALISKYKDIISYVRIGPDNGQSAAINEGWAALNADYYCWLNDDDVLHPNALETVSRIFDDTQAGVVHGRTDILEKGKLRFGYGAEPITDRLVRENPIAQPSTFVRKNALVKICEGEEFAPLAIELKYAMDWDLWQRLYFSGAKFEAIATSLSITRWYAQTKTANPSLRKYREYSKLLSHVSLATRLWTLANTFLHNQSAYGRFSTFFKPITAFLSQRKKKNSSTASFGISTGIDVYHYDDISACVKSSDSEDILTTNLQSGEVFATHKRAVILIANTVDTP